MLTYDQKSEIRMAFDEAFVPAERRRDFRTKHRVDAQICEWKKKKQGQPFPVRVEDFSPGGVGLIHDAALDMHSTYLLTVPRQEQAELVILLTVVRCVPQDDGTFHIGMELTNVMDRVALGQVVEAIHSRGERRTSKRTRFLLLLLGAFGITISLLLQLQ